MNAEFSLETQQIMQPEAEKLEQNLQISEQIIAQVREFCAQHTDATRLQIVDHLRRFLGDQYEVITREVSLVEILTQVAKIMQSELAQDPTKNKLLAESQNAAVRYYSENIHSRSNTIKNRDEEDCRDARVTLGKFEEKWAEAQQQGIPHFLIWADALEKAAAEVTKLRVQVAQIKASPFYDQLSTPIFKLSPEAQTPVAELQQQIKEIREKAPEYGFTPDF
jgi:hypothetical protein